MNITNVQVIHIINIQIYIILLLTHSLLPASPRAVLTPPSPHPHPNNKKTQPQKNSKLSEISKISEIKKCSTANEPRWVFVRQFPARKVTTSYGAFFRQFVTSQQEAEEPLCPRICAKKLAKLLYQPYNNVPRFCTSAKCD